MIHETELKVTSSGGNNTLLWTFWLEPLSPLFTSPVKPASGGLSECALLFLEDAKANYVRRFFRGDQSVFLKDKTSAL